MYMAPDTYAQICAEYKDIKERASLYLAGKDSNGKNLPMFFQQDISTLSKKIAMEMGKCELSQDCVKSIDRKNAYKAMLDDLNGIWESLATCLKDL